MGSNNLNQDNLNQNSLNQENLRKSMNYVKKNNYWNSHHHEILKSLLLNTNKLYKEYQKSHLRYKAKLQQYRIPIIVMSSFTGFLSISNSGYIPDNYTKWVSMIVGFTNLMITVISLIENYKKIDVNMNKCYTSYTSFKKLHDEIALLLKIPENERESNGYDTITDIFKRYELYLHEAIVLNKIIHDYLDTDSPENTTIYINNNTTSMRNNSNSSNNENSSNNGNNRNKFFNFFNFFKKNNNNYMSLNDRLGLNNISSDILMTHSISKTPLKTSEEIKTSEEMATLEEIKLLEQDIDLESGERSLILKADNMKILKNIKISEDM